MAATVSANLDDADMQRVRTLAAREHRSVSSFVSNAVAIFADLPKDLRDSLLELRVESDEREFRSLLQEITALVARRKLDIVTQRLVSERRLPTAAEDASDPEILDQASALVRGL